MFSFFFAESLSNGCLSYLPKLTTSTPNNNKHQLTQQTLQITPKRKKNHKHNLNKMI